MRNLPDDWATTKISFLCKVNPPKPTESDSTDVTFLPMQAVEAETGVYDPSEIRKYSSVKKGYTGFIEGDILFAKITPCMENGKIVLVDKLLNKIGFGSTEFHVLRSKVAGMREYLFFYLIQKSFRSDAQRSMSGNAGQLRVPKRFLENAVIPIAPLPEQRAIVAKIERLFSELDNGVASLREAKSQLAIYRQAVLKKAFQGELTREWREKQTDLPTAEELLEQIRQERENHYNAQLAQWKEDVKTWESNGEKGSLHAKPKRFIYSPALSKDELSKLPELTGTSFWARIGAIYQVFVGATPSRKISDYWDGHIYWVSSGEVNFSRIKETKERITSLGLCNSSTTVHPVGTVMIAMIGEGKTRGQTSILDIEACHNQNTAAIRISEIKHIPEYMYYYLMLKYNENRNLGSGNNQKALNKTRVMDIVFPLCPPSEQKQIVQEIESRLSVCDQLVNNIDQSLEKAEALRQSILKKAFEGKLLTEQELTACRAEPDYCHASELLAKRAEK